MATVPATLVTVHEFLNLPEVRGDYYYELRQGALVRVTRPKLKHWILQGRIRDLLRGVAQGSGYVDMEFAFCPLPEYELRVADVGYASQERWARIDPEGVFQGAPDLVIEVLSPSNTASEMIEKEQLCLENGSREFWVVDSTRKQVRVTTSTGHVATYKSGQAIPLFFRQDATLQVDSLF